MKNMSSKLTSKVMAANIYGKPSNNAHVSKNYSSKYLHPTQQNLLVGQNSNEVGIQSAAQLQQHHRLILEHTTDSSRNNQA